MKMRYIYPNDVVVEFDTSYIAFSYIHRLLIDKVKHYLNVNHNEFRSIV